MKELLEICAALKQMEDDRYALATVIHVEGSSYRRPGARMLLAPDGRSWGMISGGCLEHDVMEHARRAVESGAARTVRYDSTSPDDIVFGTGLGCNGVIDVFVEPITKQFRELLIQEIETCNQTRRRGGIATLVKREGPANSPVQHAFLNSRGDWKGDDVFIHEIRSRSGNGLGKLSNPELIDGKLFVQPLLPPIHLVIFGGWLDVVPLIRIGSAAGFRTTVVDAQARASSRALFHEADAVLSCPVETAIGRLQIDDRTAVVLMAHNFERDQAALGALAPARPFYLGMLGPKRRQEKIISGLRQDGVAISEDFVQRIHGPAGLDLGVSTPEGIALAIVAEIQATLNGRTGGMLFERKVQAGVNSAELLIQPQTYVPTGVPA